MQSRGIKYFPFKGLHAARAGFRSSSQRERPINTEQSARAHVNSFYKRFFSLRRQREKRLETINSIHEAVQSEMFLSDHSQQQQHKVKTMRLPLMSLGQKLA